MNQVPNSDLTQISLDHVQPQSVMSHGINLNFDMTVDFSRRDYISTGKIHELPVTQSISFAILDLYITAA